MKNLGGEKAQHGKAALKRNTSARQQVTFPAPFASSNQPTKMLSRNLCRMFGPTVLLVCMP